MSLYCTNIDVYFDNKAVYNSKCVEGHDMHNDNDNLWHQEFWEVCLERLFLQNALLGFRKVFHIQR